MNIRGLYDKPTPITADEYFNIARSSGIAKFAAGYVFLRDNKEQPMGDGWRSNGLGVCVRTTRWYVQTHRPGVPKSNKNLEFWTFIAPYHAPLMDLVPLVRSVTCGGSHETV